VTVLVFSGSSGNASVILGAVPEIRIAGGAISIGGPVIAWFRDGGWRVGSHRFDEVGCEGPVTIEIESADGPRAFGPFDGFWLKAEVACTRRGVLARYHAIEETWYFDRHGSQTETMVVKAR
jgi:hypothetical protein